MMSGGWRFEILTALDKMIETYNRAQSLNNGIPTLNIHIVSKKDYLQAANERERLVVPAQKKYLLQTKYRIK